MPHNIKTQELDTRWDFDDPNFENGIPESFSIDQVNIHSSEHPRLLPI